MTSYLAAASLLFASVFYWGPDFQLSRSATFLVLGSLWLGGIVWRRVHWSAGLAAGWALLSAIRIFGSPTSPYQHLGVAAMSLFDACSSTSLLSLLFVIVPLLFAKRSTLRKLGWAIGWLCLLNSLVVIFEWSIGLSRGDRGGLFGNVSVNPCVIAFTYPALVVMSRRLRMGPWIQEIWEVVCMAAPILAILASWSSIGLFALVAALAAVHIARREYHKLAIMLMLLLLAGHFFMGSKLGQDSGRYLLWKNAMTWWISHANPWIGTGLGTYFVFGPNFFVKQMNPQESWFPWLHNDWLQILFEQGIVGLALVVLMVAFAVRAAIKGRCLWLLGAMAAYAVAMFGDYPCYLPVPGFIGAYLILLAFGA